MLVTNQFPWEHVKNCLWRVQEAWHALKESFRVMEVEEGDFECNKIMSHLQKLSSISFGFLIFSNQSLVTVFFDGHDLEDFIIFDWLYFLYWQYRGELGQRRAKRRCLSSSQRSETPLWHQMWNETVAHFQKRDYLPLFLQHPSPQKCSRQPSGSADCNLSLDLAPWLSLKGPSCCCIITIKAHTISEVAAVSIQAYLTGSLWMNGITNHPAAAYVNVVLERSICCSPMYYYTQMKKKDRRILWNQNICSLHSSGSGMVRRRKKKERKQKQPFSLFSNKGPWEYLASLAWRISVPGVDLTWQGFWDMWAC